MGIYVGGTGSANQLDDYEEGNFTPQMNDNSGSNVVLTANSSECFYTKVGNFVTVAAQITLNETGSKSGQLYLTHLPFDGVAQAQLACGTWWMDRGFSNDTVGGVCYKIGGDARMLFVNPTAVHTNAGGDDAAKSATRYLEFSQWQNSKHIYFTMTYRTG